MLDPYAFIQWKGTDVCLDLNCSCGASTHVDGMFVYQVMCESCEAVFALPERLPLGERLYEVDDQWS